MTTIASASQSLFIQRYVPLLLTLTILILPLSSTGKSILLSLSVLAILLSTSYRQILPEIFKSSWAKASIILFGLALFACIWSPASNHERFLIVEKYSKLLYLPILVAGFSDKKTRYAGLYAFIMAMVFTAVLASLKFHGYLQGLNIHPDHIFRNHIMVGSMAAFAAYLCALLLYRQSGWIRLLYGFMFLLLTYQEFFINEGRTGYVIYLLLMMLLILQICSWRQAIAGCLIICALAAIGYTQTPLMKERVNLVLEDLERYQKNEEKNTPTGYRLQFHDYAHQLFNRKPILGNGTGSFTYQFRVENPVPAWGIGHTLLEPHSQYWLIAAEFGLVGVGALAFLVLSLIHASWRLRAMRPIAFAVLIPFLLGNLSDSLLLYSGSGYFFILFMALCLGEHFEQRPVSSPDVIP